MYIRTITLGTGTRTYCTVLYCTVYCTVLRKVIITVQYVTHFGEAREGLESFIRTIHAPGKIPNS